ncbi:unnamed protein product [Blepharisma stoltei]|uniref:Isobutyryl-CoA dehydrogenase, mitochondrial n=1 Tax=Blepharisma stoltei TaxID=1481888 RepID=A0AAU9JAZ8_9CILI|nr:unnamed protein product [Blepharisma stoltei]
MLQRCGSILTRRFSASNLLLSEEQRHLKEMVYRFSQQHIAPIAYEIDKTDSCDYRSLWPKLGELGLLGVTAAHEYGGSGLGYLDHVIITEEISRGSGSIGLSYIAHSNLCINQLVLHANEQQKKKYLPGLCDGTKIGGLAMTETGAGSDVTSMVTRAEKVDGGFLLNGSKMWITNGPYGDYIIVYAKTDPIKGKRGISAFIVEKDFKGFNCAQKMNKLGMRGSGTGELTFDNVFVPEENLLGPLNEGVYILMKGLNFERLLLSAGPVGLMQAAYDVVLPYVGVRKQFGEKIGHFQLIQSKIADIYTALNASRIYLYTIAKSCDHGTSLNEDCASVFLFNAEQGTQMALQAIQVLGGYGYINECPLGRILRDAKLYEIGGGTSEIRRTIIAKALMIKHHKD